MPACGADAGVLPSKFPVIASVTDGDGGAQFVASVERSLAGIASSMYASWRVTKGELPARSRDALPAQTIDIRKPTSCDLKEKR